MMFWNLAGELKSHITAWNRTR